MSTDIRSDRISDRSGLTGPSQQMGWLVGLCDSTGELTARGVLVLFGACTTMLCYVLSSSFGQ